ncbi:MAG: hypothetical protein ACR2QO_10225 [Acidimicrobiales bacterium]
MASTIQQPLNLTAAAGAATLKHDAAAVDVPTASGAGRLSPLALGATVMAISIVAMFVLSLIMILALTEVSTLAGVGFAVYCASWLGPGFGAVFAGAIVFGRDH